MILIAVLYELFVMLLFVDLFFSRNGPLRRYPAQENFPPPVPQSPPSPFPEPTTEVLLKSFFTFGAPHSGQTTYSSSPAKISFSKE